LPRISHANYWLLHHRDEAGLDHPQIAFGGSDALTHIRLRHTHTHTHTLHTHYTHTHTHTTHTHTQLMYPPMGEILTLQKPSLLHPAVAIIRDLS